MRGVTPEADYVQAFQYLRRRGKQTNKRFNFFFQKEKAYDLYFFFLILVYIWEV